MRNLIILITLAVWAIGANSVFAADTKVSALSNLGAAPEGTDELYINDSGTSKAVTVTNVMKWLNTDQSGGGLVIDEANADSALTRDTELYSVWTILDTDLDGDLTDESPGFAGISIQPTGSLMLGVNDLNDGADMVNDDMVSFDDTDSNYTATTIGAALEELDDVINGGSPNAATGKVDWSQLVNVPAGFADGTDEGSGLTLADFVDGTGNANYLIKDDGDGTFSASSTLSSITISGFTASNNVHSDASGNLTSGAFGDLNADQTIANDAVDMDAIDDDGNFTALTGNWATTGTLTAAIDSEVETGATLDVAAATHYGGMVVNGDADAIEFDLDSALVGMSIMVIDGGGSAMTVDPADGNTIVYDGTAAAAGEALISSGAKGDFITLICVTANEWIAIGHDSNGWTEESP